MVAVSHFKYNAGKQVKDKIDTRHLYIRAMPFSFAFQQSTNNSKINVLYSTPSCYLYQLNRADKVWPTKDDDFFPYAHRENSFWTGYFTSRAALKGYVRETNNLLQVR